MKPKPDFNPNSIENRLMRIETRLCVLMEALGVDTAKTTNPKSRGNSPQSDAVYQQPDGYPRDEARTEAVARRRSIFHRLLSQVPES